MKARISSMNTKYYRSIRAPRPLALVAAGVLASVLWIAPITGHAQEAAAQPAPAAVQQRAELTLTPAQAAELALCNSLQLQRDAQTVEQAQARLKQAQALWKSTAQASAAANYAAPTKGVLDSFTELLSVSLRKPLYTGHRLETQTALARRNIEAAAALAPITATQTALAAQTLAYNIMRLDMLANVSSQRATAVAEHLRIARAMEAAGAVPQFEVVQAETELARAKGDIIAAQTATQQARAELINLLVLPQTSVLTVQEGVPLAQPEGTLTDLVDRGWTRRPEMTLAERQLQAAKAALEVVRQSTNAQVDLVARINQQNAAITTESLNWALGLSITKSLSDGGLRRAQEQEQTSRIADTKLAIETLKQDIALEITQSSLAVTQAREQLKVAEAGEVNAHERLRMAELRFAAGLSIGIEVLDAQTSLATAQAATVNARYDLQTSVVHLRQAVGDLTAQV
jgi:outer membrane protein TolC